MTTLVIDASAGVDLLLNNANGRALTAKLPAGAKSWVPEHSFVEVGTVLRRMEAADLVPAARVAQAFEDLRTARIHRAQVRPLLPGAWARRGHLTFADALYVSLADQLGATLVTADLKLADSPAGGVDRGRVVVETVTGRPTSQKVDPPHLDVVDGRDRRTR